MSDLIIYATVNTLVESPEVINERRRLGDFEIDLIIGLKNRGAILSMIDRLSRHCLLHKLNDKSATEIEESVIKALAIYTGEK
ncbi:hypothetical protein OAO18_09070 [Francisellaceae bacterium]|nr:hypothetical protein [Francisellaceae bacterium]